MRFNKRTLLLIVSALGAAPLVSAAANVAEAISNMNEMSARITAVKASLDKYQGGIPAAREVAKSLGAAELSARAARKHLDEGDSFTPEEASRYFENYEQMAPVLLDAIGSAKDKAPLFKEYGLGSRARTHLGNLHNEKRLFEDAAKAKLPEEFISKVQPSADEISAAFDDADEAFQS